MNSPQLAYQTAMKCAENIASAWMEAQNARAHSEARDKWTVLLHDLEKLAAVAAKLAREEALRITVKAPKMNQEGGHPMQGVQGSPSAG